MDNQDYLKMYIAVHEDCPDFMVPTLVAHSVLSAHLKFDGILIYDQWLHNSFRKAVVRVNEKEFDKISQLNVHLGHENKTLDGKKICAVVEPVWNSSVPNVLKFAKLWSPRSNV